MNRILNLPFPEENLRRFPVPVPVSSTEGRVRGLHLQGGACAPLIASNATFDHIGNCVPGISA